MEIIIAIIISVPATVAAFVSAWNVWETIRARREAAVEAREARKMGAANHTLFNSRFDEMRKIMFDAGVAAEKRDQAVDDAGNGADPKAPPAGRP